MVLWRCLPERPPPPPHRLPSPCEALVSQSALCRRTSCGDRSGWGRGGEGERSLPDLHSGSLTQHRTSFTPPHLDRSAQLSIGPGCCFWNSTVEKLSVQCFEVGDKSRARAERERERERESTPATESEPRAELAQRHSHSRGGVAWCVCVCVCVQCAQLKTNCRWLWFVWTSKVPVSAVPRFGELPPSLPPPPPSSPTALLPARLHAIGFRHMVWTPSLRAPFFSLSGGCLQSHVDSGTFFLLSF